MFRSVFWTTSCCFLLAGCSSEKGIVTYNEAPSALISNPVEGAVFNEGEVIEFLGIVNDDAAIADLTVEWTSSLDGILPDFDPPDPDGNVEYYTPNLTEGPHVITLRAIDGRNAQAEAQVNIEVLNVPDLPEITVVHPQVDEKGVEGIPYVFLVEVDDYQDSPEDLLVELSSNPGGFICFMVPDGGGNAQCDATLDVGEYLLTFMVEDTDGNQAEARATFEVVEPGDFDADGDTYTPNGGDCNDNNATIYPGAPEICDGFDNDCLTSTPVDAGTDCYDDDGDGYCEQPPCVNVSASLPDCNDAAATVSPAAVEVLNGIDDDCDGLIDEGTSVYDDDGDGYCESPPCVNASGTTSDCNDGDYAINPGATEVCDDGFDQNCNGLLNEQDAIGCNTLYYDNDGDTYGDASQGAQCWCGDGTYPWTGLDATDCDDDNPNANPGIPSDSWFTSPRSNGSYDYDCDGSESARYTGITSGCQNTGISCGVGQSGWEGSQPACGQTGVYLEDCDEDWVAFLLNCGICAIPCAFDVTSSTCTSCLIGQCPTGMVCENEYSTGGVQECR